MGEGSKIFVFSKMQARCQRAIITLANAPIITKLFGIRYG